MAPSDCLVLYPGNLLESLTSLQRYGRYILWPQLIRLSILWAIFSRKSILQSLLISLLGNTNLVLILFEHTFTVYHQVVQIAQIPVTFSCHPSLLVNPLAGIQCLHRADKYRFLLISQYWCVNVW